MIKHTDLRCGNLFDYLIVDKFDERKEWYENTTIDPEDIRLCQDSNEYFNNYYKPIPLTEEWLLKFGFERMPTNSEYDYKLDDFHLNVDPDLENGYWVDGLGLMKSIQYVHQLQNLYKALSNEELTIKQP